MAEQHAGIHRTERERGQDQLRGEDRRALGPAGGGQHDERGDAQSPLPMASRLRGHPRQDATR